MKNILLASSFLFIFTNLVSCSSLNKTSLIYSIYPINNEANSIFDSLSEQNSDMDTALEPFIMNQFNNIHLDGFALLVNDSIYFSDYLGIHKTDINFENIKTIVFNEYYGGNSNTYTSIFGESMFNNLQYYNNKIYFLDRRSFSIYSMNLDGSNRLQVLNSLDFAEKIYLDGIGYIPEGNISSFIVINNKIYFNYFLNSARLHYFDLYSREIVNLEIASTPILTLSPNKASIQFTHNLEILTNLNLKDYTLESAMPLNIDYLIENKYVSHILYTTNVNGKMSFSSHFVDSLSPYIYSRIFVVGKEGYAEEIHYEVFYRNNFINIYGEIEMIEWGDNVNISRRQISMNLNSIGDWVYFTVSSPFEMVSMYRIKSDGSNFELIYKDILEEVFGTNPITINIISENIIMWKTHPRSHTINVLIRDYSTDEFENRRIN